MYIAFQDVDITSGVECLKFFLIAGGHVWTADCHRGWKEDLGFGVIRIRERILASSGRQRLYAVGEHFKLRRPQPSTTWSWSLTILHTSDLRSLFSKGAMSSYLKLIAVQWDLVGSLITFTLTAVSQHANLMCGRPGYNSSRYPHITNAILYRWIHDLAIRISTYDINPFGITPIRFDRIPGTWLRVKASVDGAPLKRDHLPTPPGDYGVFELESKESRVSDTLRSQLKLDSPVACDAESSDLGELQGC